ncbi:MAG: transporter permease, partial [Bradyrhizobium sp.]|nr:transporter permease [Bradyrhizobium sp.]
CIVSMTRSAWSRSDIPIRQIVRIFHRRGSTPRRPIAIPRCIDFPRTDAAAECGASAYGGVGRVAGAVIGALIMGVMNNGMSILGIGIDYQQVIKGLVLLGAVCLDVYNQRR